MRIPGPAAYGRGGTEATATDAMVNLGWLLPEDFLGGGMTLDADLARQAFDEGPARRSGMTVEEASMGAIQILSHSMVQSIEENSVRKGYDPRDFALVAEGGAGPLFAVPIAIEVGTPDVIVPPYPGIAAAMGLIATDMVYEYGATTYQRLSKLDVAALSSASRSSRSRRRASSRRTVSRPTGWSSSGSSTPATSARATSSGSTRRRARSTTPGWSGARGLPRRPRARVHTALRGLRHRDPQHPGAGHRSDAGARVPPLEAGGESAEAALRHEGEAWFLVGGTRSSPDALLRPRRAEGREPAGRPAIVNQYDSTTVIPPGVEHTSTGPGTWSSRSAPGPGPRETPRRRDGRVAQS